MTIIAPSLLSCDFLNIESELKKLNQINNLWIHLDIMDGHFVPNLTFGPPVIKRMSEVSSHPLDAHLMVTNPELYIETLSSMGVHNFTFHWEAVTHHDRLIKHCKQFFKSVGVSLNPSTPIEVIPHYLLKQIDLVLIMSVNPGFGGQSYISGVESKIEYLHKFKKDNNLSMQIQIDGGVTDLNSRKLAQLGATNLVAGSFIFSEPSKNYAQQVQKLLIN